MSRDDGVLDLSLRVFQALDQDPDRLPAQRLGVGFYIGYGELVAGEGGAPDRRFNTAILVVGVAIGSLLLGVSTAWLTAMCR